MKLYLEDNRGKKHKLIILDPAQINNQIFHYEVIGVIQEKVRLIQAKENQSKTSWFRRLFDYFFL
jgi:hypothetical protein